MPEKVFVLIVYILISAASLSGQCPDKDALWKRLIYLSNSSKILPKEQLEELLPILDRMNNCPYKNDSTYTFLLRRIGSNYFLLGDYLKATQYYREFIKVITANIAKHSVDPMELVSGYYFLSVFYGLLNNVSEKMKATDSCIAYAMQLKIPSDISCVRSLYNKVEYFFDIGDYHRCINYAVMCEKFAGEYTKHETDKINVEAGRTNAESSLLWRVKALLVLKEYESAEKLLTNKVEEYKNTGLKNYLGTLYSQLAEVQVYKGNYEKALSFYNKAIKYDLEAGYDFNCKQTLKDIGYNIFFKHFNDSDKALHYYRRALRLINKEKWKNTADVFESLNIFSNIANVYVAKGFYDSAYHYFELAFDQVKPGSNETDILHGSTSEFIRYKKIHYLTSLFIDKGDAFRKQYEANRLTQTIQKAINIYRMADQLLDRVKNEQLELESKLFWRSDSRRLYENAIEACFLQNNPNNAIYFFERSRAVLLNDQLREQRWLGENDILKLARLNKKINQEQKELENINISTGRAKELHTDLFTNTQELDQLIKTIQGNNPLYYQSFLDTSTLTITDFQKNILEDDQSLIEIFSGDSAVYSLVVSRKKILFTRINKSAYDNLVDNYISFISDPEKMNRDFDFFTNTSRNLYKLIFQNNSLPAGRVIISPDGQYFPFEALVTKTQPVIYFLEDHAVSYTYSARYLLSDFTTNSAISSHAFMGIAPVQYSNGLPALLGSDQSLQKMKNYFRNAANFTGNNASKSNFLKEYYKYKIIQLYTHATDSGFTGEPMIYFSDSILSMSDLFYENKPATRLIVLSACETAEGKLYNGEGVFSFNRQFAALGIPSSVSNLWQVDNQSTYKLSELFYKYLSKGLSLDIALQKAKKEFRKTASFKGQDLPYYWAAPILVGQTNEILLPKTFPWKWVALISSLLILCVWSLGRWGYKKGQ